MEPEPQKEKAGLQRREIAPDLKETRRRKTTVLLTAEIEGAAYIPKPEFAENKKKPAPKTGLETLGYPFRGRRTLGIRGTRDSAVAATA